LVIVFCVAVVHFHAFVAPDPSASSAGRQTGFGPLEARAAIYSADPADVTVAAHLRNSPAFTEDELRENPLACLEALRDHFERHIRDYTATFIKQERLHGELTLPQAMRVMCREEPLSVRMEWIENRGLCSRALYVENRWQREGVELALVEPSPVAKLFVDYVMQPVDGWAARRCSRRTIDKFGLGNSFKLILKYCHAARDHGILDLAYAGRSQIDGMACLKFVRRSAYTDEAGFWPDRVLDIYIDVDRGLPVVCRAFADDERQVLLGHYQYRDITLNVDLPDEVFTKEGMGL
jgi:hypothetical protein